MIKVRVSADDGRRPERIYAGNTTVRAIFEDAGVDYHTGSLLLNGRVQLNTGLLLDSTLDELGVTESCSLGRVGNKDNAI